MKLFFRAAADEMQECSASIVLKYLQVNMTFKEKLEIEITLKSAQSQSYNFNLVFIQLETMND